MFQRSFDFDRPIVRENERVAEATSLPPPPAAVSLLALTLVRPNRQLVYGGAHISEWPAPDHDSDTITVDRVRDDIDGPSHRFVIKRGDTVEVFFGPDRVDIGKVTDIRHERLEVRVSFQRSHRGLWFHKEQIYPMPQRIAGGKYGLGASVE